MTSGESAHGRGYFSGQAWEGILGEQSFRFPGLCRQEV
jgi:hypothetical protein